MRKIKSTALLGAFVAVASVGVISHEAHGTQVSSIINYIPKEVLPGDVSLPTPAITPSENYPSSATVILTLSGATFVKNDYYAILGAGGNASCSYQELYSGLNSLTLSNCALSTNTSYTIVGGGNSTLANNTSFTVYGSQAANSIVLSYSSNVSGDTPYSVTLADVMPQLAISVSSATQFINPASLTAFVRYFTYPNAASNSVLISNSAYNNSIWSNTISSANASYTINFLFSNIPSSVTSVTATDTAVNTSQSAIPGNQSATVSFSLALGSSPFGGSASSDTISFSFYNGGNIQLGTISLSSITGIDLNYNGSSVSYVYSSTPQNFLTFTLGGTQIYVPDALAPDDGNAIQHGYITISMPSSASIVSVNVLNVPSASCPVPTTANGALVPTSTSGVFIIDLSQLAPLCTGISAFAWQSGVPLVIYISGTNATPTQITADAYAVFGGMLKRIPVDVTSLGNGYADFNY